MRIIRCDLDNVDRLSEICKKTFEETFEDTNPKERLEQFFEENYSIPVLTEELQHPDTLVYLVEDDKDDVVGYLKLNRGDAQTEEGFDDSLEIQRIYMLRRAKGLGVGSTLMDMATEQAKQWGCSWMWLGVWEHNEPAKKFYSNRGFEEFSNHTFVVGDDPQTDILMRKEVV